MGRGYIFPSHAVVPANGAIYLRAGHGQNTRTTFSWGLNSPPFENPTNAPSYLGDGAYLLDPDGDVRAARQYPLR